MIRTLAHTCFVVADLARTEKFYCEVLGLRLAFEFTDAVGKRTGIYIACGDRSFLEFFRFRGDPQPNNPDGSFRHICLEVDDLDAMIARLTERHVDVTGHQLGGDGSWQAWIRDPDGNRIELHQYTPQSKQTIALEKAST